MPSQPTISAFFTPKSSPSKVAGKKRVSSPGHAIDLTNDDSDGEPPIKKKRLSSPSRASSSQGTAEQWRFNPTSPEKPEPLKDHTLADEATRQKRHEAFKQKLLGDNNPFIRKKSIATHESEDHVKDRDHVPEASGEDESDDGFAKLSELFSNKDAKGRSKGKTTAKLAKKALQEVGPSGQVYTPLEQQISKLKAAHQGILLMVEVGYKYRFFGEDAKVAAKELGIVCFWDRNFQVASIPIHRREVHLKKLLSQGYKVGIVGQQETAALKKVGDNKNTPFVRELTHLYTAATYVDDLDSVDDIERYSPPPLMCIIEEPKGGMGNDERVSISMISICPSTGDVVWDEFEDNHMRIELETRLVHTRPTELLLPEGGLTKASEKMLTHFTGISSAGDKIRVERFKGRMPYTEAFSFISEFYTDKTKAKVASESFTSGRLMAAVTDFPQRVVIVLAHTIKHLAAFGIADAFLDTKFFSKFTTRAHMLLAANTLTNLEVYRNETDHTTRGSLMWILDHTKSKFGARLLKSWVGRPLIDKTLLQARVDAVEEILSSSSEKLVVLRGLFKSSPDLAKGLCRIQYGKCTPQELAHLLPAFNKIACAFDAVNQPADVGFKSVLLNDIISSFPRLKKPMRDLLDIVSVKRAAEGRKDTMWIDPERYPMIADTDLALQAVEVELMEELKSIRKVLKKPSLAWTSVAGEEYLVEVKKSENRIIPSTWHIVSRTRISERYHTPEVKSKLQERAQLNETLQAEAQRAFSSFLDEIAQNYYGVMRDVVNKLATADCLLGLAHVALQEGYVRPQFTDDDTLEIVDGRHPMVEALRSDPFVPNSVCMGGGQPRSKVITGPNMGGKSSSVRMIALIALMAQIGSYVPATSVKLGMLDSILTRMGASDDLARGRSTFMVEMSETSDILRTATERSLVILDELGRGTSTFDGMAIAGSVLHHLVEATKCKTLFITHYPSVAIDLQRRFPHDIQNLHMGYSDNTRIDGRRDITFLYRLASGLAEESFGVECARLAGLPEVLLDTATERSSRLRKEVEERSKRNRVRKYVKLLNQCVTDSNDNSFGALKELRINSEC